MVVIGLIPLYDDEKESYWMLPGYMKAIEDSGALPIMLPLTDNEEELRKAYELCDGLLLTGGHDISPSLYGEKPADKCGVICPLRDKMESFLLGWALDDDMPVLGICRGIQFINAFLGGTLYQDIPSEHGTSVEHHMSPPYDRTAHRIEVMKDTLLSDIIGAGGHEVNSYHHQAVKNVPDRIEIMAVSEDGIVESIAVKEKSFAVGVQWHPEFSYEKDEDSRRIVRAFIDACISKEKV